LTSQKKKKKKGRLQNKTQQVMPTIEKEPLSTLNIIEIPSEIDSLPISPQFPSLPTSLSSPIETQSQIESSLPSSTVTSLPPLIHL
jgi:hypothetical protein